MKNFFLRKNYNFLLITIISFLSYISNFDWYNFCTKIKVAIKKINIFCFKDLVIFYLLLFLSIFFFRNIIYLLINIFLYSNEIFIIWNNFSENFFYQDFFKWFSYSTISYLFISKSFINFIISLFYKIIFGILVIVPILLIIAYSTLLERKVLSSIQKRWGPNKVGIKGSVQPLVDGVKLILKEIIIPVQAENNIFIIASKWSIFFMLLLWFIVPTSIHGNVLEFDYEILILFCVSVLGSISILLAGWSSNSKYSFLGGIRAGAQMISYELVLGLIVLEVMTVTSTTQIIEIVEFQNYYLPLFFLMPIESVIFLIIIVAETNRAPFDFAEAESELVSGYNTEYSGLPFAFFFIAEYGNILYMSLLFSLFFLNGWNIVFFPFYFPSTNFFFSTFILFLKMIFIYFCFIWLWGALPRYRYDQLMSLCWKTFLPLVLVLLIIWITTYQDFLFFLK